MEAQDVNTQPPAGDGVRGAAAVGYRHFDCASVYGNESLIGQSWQDLWDPSGQITPP